MEKKTTIPVGIVKVLWDYDEYGSRVIEVFYVLDIVYDKKYNFCNNFYFMNGIFCTGNRQIYSSNLLATFFDKIEKNN